MTAENGMEWNGMASLFALAPKGPRRWDPYHGVEGHSWIKAVMAPSPQFVPTMLFRSRRRRPPPMGQAWCRLRRLLVKIDFGPDTLWAWNETKGRILHVGTDGIGS